MPIAGLVPLPFLAVMNQDHNRPSGVRVMTTTYHCGRMFFQLFHEERNRLESLITNQSNCHSVTIRTALTKRNVTDFSESTSVNDMLGITLEATSSTSKQSTVAMKPINPATRA